MNLFKNCLLLSRKVLIGITAWLISLTILQAAYADPAQSPLFLSAPVKPIMMLNMSKEHQLYFKLYDDYSDITNAAGSALDGVADTTYNNNYNYYGYFDSDKCYVYSSTDKRFNPDSFRTSKYCNAATVTNQWSGNFLNWASMTRMDAIRKMLYGGYRSTDNATTTVLERAFLPNDAHSFAKYYGGADLNKLSPITPDTTDSDLKKRGITICNTSEPSDRSKLSQETIGADLPLIRVARGNYSLWASNERWQCRWGVNSNDNNVSYSGINAYSSSPSVPAEAYFGDYIVRINVCVSGLIATSGDNEKCQSYGTVAKPTGLLHKYGEKDDILFGLLTGSYGMNKSGGVLRKKVGSITDEINSADGTFKIPSDGNSIIGTLNLLRIYGYRFDSSGDGGTYHSKTGSDNCIWGLSAFGDDKCTNWGNPQAEIYLESLRYLAGKKTPNFDVNDATKIPNLKRVGTWNDPVSTAADGNFCAPLNVLQFNASTTSYDTDGLSGASSWSEMSTYDAETDSIGIAEGVTGSKVFIGKNGGTAADEKDELCGAKSVVNFAELKGICPESPRLEGGYKIAGLAYLARKSGIATGREKVKTFGVALAPAVPRVTIAVPGSTSKTVTILPACRNLQPEPDANCAIVDFKVVDQTLVNGVAKGRLYVNWEDSEQGGDFDQDMWGVINYEVSSTQVKVTTKVVAESTSQALGFGYVISGTDRDGFHVHSGVEGFNRSTSATELIGCTECKPSDPATTETYNIGSSTAATLLPPLYYAAKWGGYKDNADGSPVTASAIAGSQAETYFYATDPRQLEAGLNSALGKIAESVGSAATVAANSTRLDGETLVYQAKFNSKDWSGSLVSYPLLPDGSANIANPKWDTDNTLTRSSTRNIYTYDGSTVKTTVKLSLTGWESAAPTLLSALKLSSESDNTKANQRLAWIFGSDAQESAVNGLRARTKVLGDIVNSDPAFAGRGSQRYESLPTTFGSATYAAYVEAKQARVDVNNPASAYVRKAAVFVGANDGMMHAFNADTGAELFAYIPRGVYSKLAEISKKTYSHQYSVDGPMYSGDIYYDRDGTSGPAVAEWRTVVTGSLGAGGRGAYALDITDVLSSGGGDPIVLFDVSANVLLDVSAGENATAVPYYKDLGFAAGKVFVLPAQDGSWRALFGNGPNSVNGYSKLIAINIATPSTYTIIDTKVKIGSTNQNGLGGLAVLPDGTGVASYIYAGDIAGNMWKLDLSDPNPTKWESAYKSGSTPAPLINAIDSSGVVQSITASPTLGYNDVKKVSGKSSVMVYFGTGKYNETGDNSSTQVQSIYGIADSGSAISLTSTNRTTTLKEKDISAQTATQRTITPDATGSDKKPVVDWLGSTPPAKNGWFVDLQYGTKADNSLIYSGERVVSKPLLLYDKVIITTFIPSLNRCDYGGSGWLMELTGVGDKFIGQSVLTTQANHILDNVIMGDLTPIISGDKLILLGSGLGKKDQQPPLIKIDGVSGIGTRGRMSWRQIK